MMKKILLVLILIFLLTSCSNAPAAVPKAETISCTASPVHMTVYSGWK